MDNHESHNRQEILAQMNSANIVPISLPAHSSHFLQVLDVGLFGACKTTYRNGRTKSTNPQLEGKMLRVLKAWHTTSWPVTIWNFWQASGVQFTTIYQVSFHASVDLARVKELD
jgi:hypothetical protein